MKCWKCEQELADGSCSCVYCGASQKRPEPVTEVGSALRKMYDHYGARQVFGNSAYLVNGLGDLVEDSKKLRNQIKIGMDAGLGRLYLEQLESGKPDKAFDSRVRSLLTKEAGLNENTAREIAAYFDEMIGWRVAASEQKAQNTQKPQQQKQQYEEKNVPDLKTTNQGKQQAEQPAAQYSAKKEKMTWKKSVLIAAMIFNTLMYIVFAVTTPEASVGMCIALLFNFFSFRSVIRRDAGVEGIFLTFIFTVTGFVLLNPIISPHVKTDSSMEDVIYPIQFLLGFGLPGYVAFCAWSYIKGNSNLKKPTQGKQPVAQPFSVAQAKSKMTWRKNVFIAAMICSLLIYICNFIFPRTFYNNELEISTPVICTMIVLALVACFFIIKKGEQSIYRIIGSVFTYIATLISLLSLVLTIDSRWVTVVNNEKELSAIYTVFFIILLFIPGYVASCAWRYAKDNKTQNPDRAGS